MCRPWLRDCWRMTRQGRVNRVLDSIVFCWGARGGGRSAQQALGANVLVDVGPMNTISATGELPVAALFGGGMEQPWIPSEGDRDRPAILQANAKRVLIETHVRHSLICRYCQNTHSRPPEAVADSPARLIV